MIGTSGAPDQHGIVDTNPAIAERRCSTVETRASPLASVVDSVVSPTLPVVLECPQVRRGRFGENNTGIRCRWPQHQVDLVTRVKSYTSGADDVFQRPLSNHKSCPDTVVLLANPAKALSKWLAMPHALAGLSRSLYLWLAVRAALFCVRERRADAYNESSSHFRFRVAINLSCITTQHVPCVAL